MEFLLTEDINLKILLVSSYFVYKNTANNYIINLFIILYYYFINIDNIIILYHIIDIDNIQYNISDRTIAEK